MVAYTRDLLAQRNALPAMLVGDLQMLDTPPEIVAFLRKHPSGDVLCAFNLADGPVDWDPPLDCHPARLVASESAIGSGEPIPRTMARRSGYWAPCGGPCNPGDGAKRG